MLKLTKLRNHTNTVNKYLVALLLLFVPLYPKFPLLSIPGSSVSIRLEDFVVFFSFLVWGLFNYHRIPSLLKSKLAKAIMLFLTVGFIAVVSGVFITQTVNLSVGSFHWIRRIQYLLPLFIGLTAINSKSDLKFYLKVLLTVVVFSFIYGIGQKYFNWPIITTQNAEYAKGVALFYVPGAHLVSTFAGHYDLANFLVLIAPIFIALAVSSKTTLSKLSISNNVWISRLLLAVISVMILWLIVNAASRISVVTYMGSVALVLLLLRRYLWIPIIIAISFLFILTSSKLMDRYVRIFEVAIENVISAHTIVPVTYAQEQSPLNRGIPSPTPAPQEVFEDRSSSIRFNVEWPRAIRAFNKNPLLGTGYSSITLATDNGYLRMLGEVGLVGTLAFFLILARIFNHLKSYLLRFDKNKLSDIFVISIIAAIPGIMLNMVFIDILESSKFALMFWLLIGISISCAKFDYGEKNHKPIAK